MRADMFKVIVERPRWGAGHAPAVKLKKKGRKDEIAIGRIGLRRHAKERAAYTKSLNENLAPLARFVQRRVGRRWDDVFSEICAGLDTGSTVKMHVRQHLRDFVLVPISRGRHGEWLHEGRILRPHFRYGGGPEYYVDPDDGILKDRCLFWRDRGEAVPARRNQLRWEKRR
ncbi:MAG TPA: hypothetical protein VFW19_08710 [Allosphingosinicella sp.]|nr:hypothetical protein [Allosphingosinicella sp.]